MVEQGERYRSFSRYLRERYGERVWKVSVDAGFTCPNRDGASGRGGCIFCRLESFSKMQSRIDLDVAAQVEEGIKIGRQRQGIEKFIVYFQSSTNTYAPVELLRPLYEKAAAFPGVVGLAISTRPDCLGREVLALIAELAGRIDLWIELGLQSIHDQTLNLINRGHTYADYLGAVGALQRLPLRICTHLMLGLPGESAKMMRDSAAAIAHSPIHEIKLHPLLILQGTPLSRWHKERRVEALGLEEYADLVVDFIELMPETMVMQRLTAEAPAEMLIAPRWALDKQRVRREIEHELVRRDTWQGKCFV